MITKQYYKVYRVEPDPDYFWVESKGNNTARISFEKQGTPYATNFEYSLDKRTWTTGMSVNNVEPNTKVYFRGINEEGFSKNVDNFIHLKVVNASSTFVKFNFNVGGNVITLLDYTNADGITSIGNYCFNQMFLSKSVVDASELYFGNVTTVGSYGMYSMFNDCQSLTTPPDLSGITTVGSYGMDNMFTGCSSLTTSPDLSGITTVGSYGMQWLFRYCTSLNYVIAPSISSWNINIFNAWLENTASTGVIQKPASLTIHTGSISGVPTGWTTVDR